MGKYPQHYLAKLLQAIGQTHATCSVFIFCVQTIIYDGIYLIIWKT